MSKEGGSFAGGARSMATASRSVGRSFGAERTGALSFKIGPVKSSPSVGLRMGEFLPSAPRFSEKRANFVPSRMREWNPQKNFAKPNKYRIFESHAPFKKTTTEKAGIAPYRQPKTVFAEKSVREEFSTKPIIPDRKLFVPKLRPVEVKKANVVPRVNTDQSLEQKVVQAQQKVNQVLVEKYKKVEWVPKLQRKEVVLPRLKKAAVSQGARTLEQPTALKSVQENARKVQIVTELRSIAKVNQAVSVARNQPRALPETLKVSINNEKKIEQQAILATLVKRKEKEKKKEEKKKFYVVDTKASMVRINMALMAAVSLINKNVFGMKKRLIGTDLVSYIPQTAPKEGISKLVQDRKSSYDGSYEEWRNRLASMTAKKSVGEVISVAKSANAAAPPVELSAAKNANVVTIKDVFRVLLGPDQEANNEG